MLSKCCASMHGVCCARPDVDSTTEYYEDTFNDESWECTFGTNDQDGIWVNCRDKVGQIMSTMVWLLISYSVLTISLLAHNQNLPNSIAMVYATICSLALASHVKTMFTDPGSIPREAVPRAILFRKGITTHAMCSHCQTYKPPKSHHCRICNRCISRMDRECGAKEFEFFLLTLCCKSSHMLFPSSVDAPMLFAPVHSSDHCPWMNNCVGANNFSEYCRIHDMIA